MDGERNQWGKRELVRHGWMDGRKKGRRTPTKLSGTFHIIYHIASVLFLLSFPWSSTSSLSPLSFFSYLSRFGSLHLPVSKGKKKPISISSPSYSVSSPSLTCCHARSHTRISGTWYNCLHERHLCISTVSHLPCSLAPALVLIREYQKFGIIVSTRGLYVYQLFNSSCGYSFPSLARSHTEIWNNGIKVVTWCEL